MSRRGWVVVGWGLIVSLAPLAWEQLLSEYPAHAGLGLVLLYLWSALPFVVLGAFAGGLKLHGAAVLFDAALVTAATVFMQVDVIFSPGSSTDGLAFLFVPVWLAVAVGLLAGFEVATRALARVARGYLAKSP